MKNKQFLVLTLIILVMSLFSVDLLARHIVGGEITYECIGQPNANSRTYRVQIFVYRDCFGNGARFDSDAGSASDFEMSIFRGNQLFSTVTIGSEDLVIENIPVDFDNPCVIFPPNVCVERGVYTAVVTLPISPTTYTIAYQRCCRNETISNIINPGDAGATYLVEISPTAQQSCNSSPSFNLFPPIVICANSLLEFDHSATDSDGDELRYRLGDPFYGGGNITSGPNQTSFNGVTPNPESPPPYTPIDFLPGFSSQQPVDGGNPIININPNTGLLQVNPQTTGQFVLCVVVEEYRNGELIGFVRRDFQFNIVECDPLISANITAVQGADSVAPNLVLICGDRSVELVDISTDRQFIDRIEWLVPNTIAGDFSSNNSVVNIEFQDYGTYPGQLIANPGFPCTDTADFNIVLSPPIEVDYSFSYDTCVNGPIDFVGEVTLNPDNVQRHLWDFGNGDSANEPETSYQYPIAGSRFVTYSVFDDNNCQYTESRQLDYFPVPATLLVTADATDNCAPATFRFRQQLDLITEEYDVLWDFGNGDTSTLLNPNYQYPEPGTYTIYVSATSPFDCFVDTTLSAPINILESPDAAFDLDPEEVNILDAQVFFFDQSRDAASWQWFFDSLGTSRQINPTYTFPDTGNFKIDLVVSHLNGCLDTASQFLRVNPFQTYFVPNAFTPNDDGTNDFFRGTGFTRYISEFQLDIYNRWGELVFRTDDIEESWNGINQRNGEQSPPGVYLYVVNFNGINGEEQQEGFVTLIE